MCSIEANFAEALSGPSNVAFMRDLRDWSALATGGRLHIWDYTTDFSGYFQPYPNMGILGENLRIFAQHNVVSVLEEVSAMRICCCSGASEGSKGILFLCSLSICLSVDEFGRLSE